jgi:hypothetical protein
MYSMICRLIQTTGTASQGTQAGSPERTIPKSGFGFRESCSNKKLEWDDDSKKSPALPSRCGVKLAAPQMRGASRPAYFGSGVFAQCTASIIPRSSSAPRSRCMMPTNARSN